MTEYLISVLDVTTLVFQYLITNIKTDFICWHVIKVNYNFHSLNVFSIMHIICNSYDMGMRDLPDMYHFDTLDKSHTTHVSVCM